MKNSVMLIFILAWIVSFVAETQSDCPNPTILDYSEFPNQEYELVYLLDETLQTSDHEIFNKVDPVTNFTITMDYDRVAWVQVDVLADEKRVGTLFVYDASSNTLDTLSIYTSEGVEPDIIYWIDHNQIMVFYITRIIRIPEWYPGSIINVDTSVTEYIYPDDEVAHLFEPAHNTQLIDYWHFEYLHVPIFSPSGQYLVLVESYPGRQHKFAIDTSSREIVQDDLKGIVFSYDSQFVLGFEKDQETTLSITVYNVLDNTIVSQHKIENFIGSSWKGTWSPNNRIIALYLYKEGTSYLSFVDLDSDELTQPCLVEFEIPNHWKDLFESHWSPDGRYLAVYGVPESQVEPKTGTIYIYDTQTDIAYEVFTGDAQIVGWLKTQDE